jgi:hypothetical protein
MKREGLCRDIVTKHTIRSTVQHGHTVRTPSTGTQYGHPVRTPSTDTQYGHPGDVITGIDPTTSVISMSRNSTMSEFYLQQPAGCATCPDSTLSCSTRSFLLHLSRIHHSSSTGLWCSVLRCHALSYPTSSSSSPVPCHAMPCHAMPS